MKQDHVQIRKTFFYLQGLGAGFFYLEDKNVLYNVCWFLLYNKVNQLLYIHPHPLEPPSNPAPIPPLQVITDRGQDLILSGESVSCRPVCNPIDCSPLGSCPRDFPSKEYWSGQPFPFPRDLPDSGIKLGSPALQADSLPRVGIARQKDCSESQSI